MLPIASRTFTLAAEDTVASAISWTLYELSRCPGYQSRVREEIVCLADYENMPLLNAAINVLSLLRLFFEIASLHEPIRKRCAYIPSCSPFRGMRLNTTSSR